MNVQIIKSDGTRQDFAPQKLIASLERAGAPAAMAQHIERDVEKELYSGMATNEIYSHAFAHLRREHKRSASRYSLKRAVLEFGPSGFPFEAYIAELYRAEGYEAQIDQIIKGACVEHEVDVVIQRGGETIYGEAKFHNSLGIKSDLKTVLYVQARIEDIQRAQGSGSIVRGLVVTNTKFTDKALQYAQCQGLELLSWDYPQTKNLHDRIDQAKLYPVTALTTLSRREKMALLNDKKVLCKTLPAQPDALARAGISGKKADAVIEEVGALCVPGNDI